MGGGAIPGGADGAIRLANGGPNDDRTSSSGALPAGACTADSCSTPPRATYGQPRQSTGPNWRPGGTSDFDPTQWSGSSTRTADGQSSSLYSAKAGLSSQYGERSGSTGQTRVATAPEPERSNEGTRHYTGELPPRDSGFYGGSSTY